VACGVFPPGGPGAHNVPVTYGQTGTVCPQCGSTDAVHSIQELATLAQARMGQGPAAPQQGTPVQAGPAWAAGAHQGWAAEPQAGPLPGPGGGRAGVFQPQSYSGSGGAFDTGSLDDIAGAVLGAAGGAAARFLGRQIGKKMQDKLTQQVLPAMAARQQGLLQTQIAIAQRHPDLCACLNDQVIFLTGGSRTLPMPNLSTVTVEQADAMVARLRDG
jgi:hypothetical protein